MAVSNKITSKSVMGKTQMIYGRLTFSGTYPAGGEVLKMSSIRSGGTRKPLGVTIRGSVQTNLYYYDDVNQKVVVRTAAGAEIPAAAYPAPVTTDLVDYTFAFSKF